MNKIIKILLLLAVVILGLFIFFRAAGAYDRDAAVSVLLERIAFLQETIRAFPLMPRVAGEAIGPIGISPIAPRCDSDGNCEANAGENSQNCPSDCPVSCNSNNICETELGENETNCANDCGCNKNNICEPHRTETKTNCPSDCDIQAKCNSNGTCETNLGENEAGCPSDCGCNKNGECQKDRGENYWNCKEDCPCNANLKCEAAENAQNCPGDCGCNSNKICEINRGETAQNCADCVATKRYNCVSGQCVENASGAYTSTSTCQLYCKKPATPGYKCVNNMCAYVADGSVYGNLTSCKLVCGKNSTPGYNCVNQQCVYAADGAQFSSLNMCAWLCKANTPPKTAYYACLSGSCVASTAAAPYKSLVSCQAACKPCSVSATAGFLKSETTIASDTSDCKNITDYGNAKLRLYIKAKCGTIYIHDDSSYSDNSIKVNAKTTWGGDVSSFSYIYECSGKKEGNYYVVKDGDILQCTVWLHIKPGNEGGYVTVMGEITDIYWYESPDGFSHQITLADKFETRLLSLKGGGPDYRMTLFPNEGFCGLNEGGKCDTGGDCVKAGPYQNICRAKKGGFFDKFNRPCADTGGEERKYCWYSFYNQDKTKTTKFDCVCVKNICKWDKVGGAAFAATR